MSRTTWLTEVEARLEKATQGPWIIVAQCERRVIIRSDDRIVCYLTLRGLTSSIQKGNGDLIAHAPTDLDKACRVIRMLREALQKARDEVAVSHNDPGASLDLIGEYVTRALTALDQEGG